MDYSADWLAAFDALKSVCSDGAYSNMALNEAIPRHKGCRDSFVRNMVKGTIRQTVTLDCIIGMLADKGLRGLKTRTLIILRLGLFAIREMDAVPDHAAVNEAVRLARKTAKGTDRFINAILRSYLRRRDEFECPAGSADGGSEPINPPFISGIRDRNKRLSVKYSMPEPLVRLISEQYGDEAESILAGLNDPPDVVLRVNTLKTTRDELMQSLRNLGIECTPAEESERAVIARGSGIIGSDLYRNGMFSVQSLSSITAVEALSPAPGSDVLDMCAAPGGKSVMMVEMMENRGHIISCDIHEHRLDIIRAAAARTGAEIISVKASDGTIHDPSMENAFDYVLADVPCSGLGVIGTKPEIRLRTDVTEYEGLTDIQLAILKNAFSYVKPGGRVCYSTCTINSSENGGVIDRFMQGAGGATSGEKPSVQGFARIVEMNTILPYNNLIGFYYCIIEKNV